MFIGYLIPMPNAISPTKKSVTFLENRTVLEWMEAIARTRETNVSVILREATSAYHAQHRSASAVPNLLELRSAQKAAQRTATAREIASGRLTPGQAQELNAPIHTPVRISNIWAAIRRHTRASKA